MELADEDYARPLVSMLIRSFPMQPSDPTTYAKQLTMLCLGKPRELVRRMVHPIDGIVAKAKFLPSVAEVGEWFAKQPYAQPKSLTCRALHKPVKPDPEMTAEDRARCDAMWAKTKPVLLDTAKAMRVNRHYDGKQQLDWGATQTHAAELLLQGLKNLGEMQPKAKEMPE